MPAQQPKSYQLFGIISLDGAPPSFGHGTSVVAFRDLGAVVAEAAYLRHRASADRIAAYRQVVEGVFAVRSVVPAPFGTVFRSRDALIRWLELHYFTLLDALTFVEDRVVARISVSADGHARDGSGTRYPPDVQASATESFSVLRRHAVASLPTSKPAMIGETAPTVGASFLIERERWSMFADVVREETKRTPAIRIEQTGPWPPYDFVRMEFGG